MHIIREVSQSLTLIDKPFVLDLRMISSFTQFFHFFLHSLSHCVLYPIDTLYLISKNNQLSAPSSLLRTFQT